MTSLHGKPYRRILEIAARDKTDPIVMGVRGRNPLDLMMFASTTNHVVRQASCPVLTLRQ
jgi:nucleotide-binding universal stress UspA family protein